jgi:hypothetical protein
VGAESFCMMWTKRIYTAGYSWVCSGHAGFDELIAPLCVWHLSLDCTHNVPGGTEENHELPVRIAGVPAEIRTSVSEIQIWRAIAAPCSQYLLNSTDCAHCRAVPHRK